MREEQSIDTMRLKPMSGNDITLAEVIERSIKLCNRADYIAHHAQSVEVALKGLEPEGHIPKGMPNDGDRLRIIDIMLSGIENSLDIIHSTIGVLDDRLVKK